MPGKLTKDAKCPVCGGDIVAVIRNWGPLTRFDYIHAEEPHVVHSTAMPMDRAKKQQESEEENSMIEVPS